MERRNLVFVVDEKNDYARHLGVTLYSILHNSSVTWQVNVLHGNLSEASREKLIQICEKFKSGIDFFKIEEDFFENLKIVEGSYLNKVVYARLAVPEILENEKRALYLDCDLVIEKDLQKLYDTDMEGFSIACVPDGKGDQQRSRDRLNLPEDLEYFNAGVMLMDLEALRENGKLKETIKFCKETDIVLELNEQDALNIVFKGQYKKLPLIWNVTHGNQEENEFQLDEIGVIHYTGSIKPWDARCVNPFRKRYLKYLEMTPWKGYPLGNDNLKNRIKREIRMLKQRTKKQRYALKEMSGRSILNNLLYVALLGLIYYLVYQQNFRTTFYYIILGIFGIDTFYFKTKIRIEKIDLLCGFYILGLLISSGLDGTFKLILIATLPLLLRNFEIGVKKKTLIYIISSGILFVYFRTIYQMSGSLRMMFSSIRRYAIMDFAVYTSILVSLLVAGILLSIYWFKRNKFLALWTSISALGSLTLLLLTHQRAILLGLIGATIVVILALRNKKAIGILLAATLIGGSGAWIAREKIPVLQRFKEIDVSPIQNGEYVEGGKLTRYEAYTGGIKIFLEHPVKGVGIKNYSSNEKVEEYFYRDTPYFHAHNIYITTLATTGVVGFISVFLLFLYILGTTFRGTRKNREESILLYLMIFNMIFGVFDNSLGTIPMGILLILYGMIKQGAFKLPVLFYLLNFHFHHKTPKYLYVPTVELNIPFL